MEEARLGWQRWKDELKGVSEREGKNILFAEYGYRSVDYAGKEPWKSDREMSVVNLEAQINLTKALFDEIIVTNPGLPADLFGNGISITRRPEGMIMPDLRLRTSLWKA